MRSIRTAFSALLLVCAGAASHGQAPAKIEFRFENAKLHPSLYVFQFHEDGNGTFHAEPGPPSTDDVAGLPPKGQDRPIHLSRELTDRAFTIARQKKFFNVPCDSGNDSIAFQGKKTLSYTGPDGQGSCTYNYSKVQQIQWLTAQLQGAASTLEEGRRLDLEYDHEHLALDGELETLETLVESGQATELSNIAPILRTIIGDDRVLERAQRRARKLLNLSESTQAQK